MSMNDRAEIVWINMLRSPSISIDDHLAVGWLQLPKLYNALSVKKDHGTQPILRFAEITLLICHWSGSGSTRSGSSSWEILKVDLCVGD